ncbi:hypothetical protein BGC07_01850 [Piscirickettsia litoralis]|uniref:histidine kinase n=1 Tax=Piscirickettsia litoralis TaxID=1891921 RepID=A0ABX2ZZX5_9GAMM|nr:hypothetical protein BGC07_01850 [Piscirickettsia litoralis]
MQELMKSNDVDYIIIDSEKLLNETEEGLSRVIGIVDNLRSFSRVDEEAEKGEVDIHKCIDSTLKIIESKIKYNCNIVKDYGESITVKGEAGKLNQVFMNLLVNASQAIDDQGEIRIKTEVRDNKAIIKISDTGKGIEDKHLETIFDPFFTTKKVGEGTGLGLSIVYGVIEEHCGKISVSSQVGVGTTFKIVLPSFVS